MKCKLLKIARTAKGFPSYHFQINEKVFIYGFKGITQDDKIVLLCSRPYQKDHLDYQCRCLSFILPSESLREIIEKMPKRRNGYYPKTMARSNPRVYDVNNYNINSFAIGKGHRCLSTELDAYIKKYKP